MVTVETSIIDQVQIALFPNNFIIQDSSILGAKLLSNNFISDEKLVINSFLTSNAPGDIVRVEAVLKDYPNVQLKIAQTKVSLYFTNPTNDINFKVDIGEMEKIINKMYGLILKDLTFKRIGYITRVFKVVNNPVDLFREKISFGNKIDLNDVEIKLTFTAIFDNKNWEKIKFNKHVVLGTGYVTKDPSQKTAIIQYDLNVQQEQDPKWDLSNSIEFLRESNLKSSDAEVIFKEIFK